MRRLELTVLEAHENCGTAVSFVYVLLGVLAYPAARHRIRRERARLSTDAPARPVISLKIRRHVGKRHALQ
jgi:hypothetical protein